MTVSMFKLMFSKTIFPTISKEILSIPTRLINGTVSCCILEAVYLFL